MSMRHKDQMSFRVTQKEDASEKMCKWPFTWFLKIILPSEYKTLMNLWNISISWEIHDQKLSFFHEFWTIIAFFFRLLFGEISLKFSSAVYISFFYVKLLNFSLCIGCEVIVFGSIRLFFNYVNLLAIVLFKVFAIFIVRTKSCFSVLL